ncbi:MAG TPA: class I SAM-dependent methyltransferase [Anaerolinea sp.]|nr:class I SAM-dependent methyltransferase [Anaerolinea sp.]
MNLMDLINRPPRPAPWAEGDNIPWNEPGFSRRMLKEHLSQDHDAASRRFEVIDRHVAWMHRDLLGGKPARILDLGCGPGLYAQRLAMLGHRVTGIDFGPASLEYARREAEREGLDCEYRYGDLREVDFGQGFDLVMQVYGELNVFSPADAALILSKAHRALNEEGALLMEVQSYPAVQRVGQAGPGWHSAKRGLFSDEPYLFLSESFWQEDTQTSTERMYVVDGTGAQVSGYALTYQAYQDEDYVRLFERAGFAQVQFLPAMGGDLSAAREDFFPVVARKKGLE